MLNMSKHGEVTGLKWPSGKRMPVGNMGEFKIYPDENCLRYDHEDKPLYTELATTRAVIDEFVRYGKSVAARYKMGIQIEPACRPVSRFPESACQSARFSTTHSSS